MAFAPAALLDDQDRTGPYGLRRPDLGEARQALQDLYGATADGHWSTLTSRAGITGRGDDSDAFHRLVEAMLAADPVTALCGRALQIRMSTFEYLTRLNAIVRAAE